LRVLTDDMVSSPADQRTRRSKEDLVQDFWTEIGFPMSASRFWERRSLTSLVTFACMLGSFASGCRDQGDEVRDSEAVAGSSLSSSSQGSTMPSRNAYSLLGIQMARSPGMGLWRGQLPW
jgi:hypothetical protein